VNQGVKLRALNFFAEITDIHIEKVVVANPCMTPDGLENV
jgi:hypothetical protein